MVMLLCACQIVSMYVCLDVCVQPTNNTAEMFALHSFNSTHHYEFTLHITNVTESDIHRYDLQVSSYLGTTVGSVHLVLGQFSKLVDALWSLSFCGCDSLSLCLNTVRSSIN